MLNRITIVFLVALLTMACKREFACWCTADVTVEGVETTHKYKETIVSKTRKDGKKKCAKLARDTEYSIINCTLYDY